MAEEAQTGPWSATRLTGHDWAERALLEAHASGRLPHAWLIAGPRGIGKATLAYRFARFLLARGDGDGADLFGAGRGGLAVDPAAPAARLVAQRSHPDLKVVERAHDDRGRLRSEIVVPQIRELVRFFTLTSADGGWRVAIVDGAEEMNANAANAILKTLEEPPGRSILLLVAHAAGRLLPTIRSRCRRLNLRPLDEAAVIDVLEAALPDLDGEERAALARLAEGSPGRAVALAQAGGLDIYRQLVDWSTRLPALPLDEVHALGDRLNRRDADAAYRTWIDLFELWLARAVRTAGTGVAGPEAVPGEWALAERLRAAGGLDRWVELWEKVSRLAVRADSVNLERKQVVLNACLALASTARAELS